MNKTFSEKKLFALLTSAVYAASLISGGLSMKMFSFVVMFASTFDKT